MLSLLAFLLMAQSPAPPAAAAPDIPADRKAWMELSKIKEPKPKLLALEKFMRENPKSGMLAMARESYVGTLVKVAPSKASGKTEKLAKTLSPGEAAGLFKSLADNLKDASGFDEQSEKAARRALELITSKAAEAEARAEAEKMKDSPAMVAMIEGRQKTQPAAYHFSLGQVMEKRGRAAEAQAQYVEALKIDPRLSGAAVALAGVENAAGHTDLALAYQAQSLLSSATPEGKKVFAEMWTKAKGSTTGMEAYLDARHKELFKSPAHAEAYKAPATRTSRVALAEIYTGAGCPPCAGADMAFDVVLERYPRADVAVLMFHQHIPRPDPIANSDTVARWKWLQGRGVPTMLIDGVPVQGGGGNAAMAQGIANRLIETLDERLQRVAGAAIELGVSNTGRVVTSTIGTRTLEQLPDLKIHVALVEKEIHYSGENGVRFHPMVVRAFATLPLTALSIHMFDLETVRSELKKHIDEFEKHDDRHNKDGNYRFYERRQELDAANLAVVVFIQNTKTREVLQAAYADAPRK
jgi:tetratricopeptide (TPR) repeat protein